MSTGLGRASLVENVRFNATVVVPNAIQGIFRRRRQAVRAATATNVDGQAVSLLEGMSRSYDGGPVWVKLVRDNAVLLLDPADVGRLLDQSPDPFASDPKAKRDGMVAFQPDALTISRGGDWESRRRFAEEVLGAASLERARAITREEIELAIAASGGELGWTLWNSSLQRVTRRIVLGDEAAGDEQLTETLEGMMDGANGMPGKPSEDLEEFERLIAAYIERAEPGSLAALAADADASVRPGGQLTHWLFALGDTLAINALRALVLLACHGQQRTQALGDASGRYLEACLQEAMRLWPTTTMLSRVSLAPTVWGGERVETGTQFVIVNAYGHRDRDRLDFADRFAPEEWIDGDAAANPAFNHFSRGPQGCPGQALALTVGVAALQTVLERGLTPGSPHLDPSRPLPHMLDFFGASVRIGL